MKGTFMQGHFETACRAARSGIVVPPVPLAAIRSKALIPVNSQRRTGKRWLLAAALAGLTGAAAAAVGVTHVSFTKSGGVVLNGGPVAAKANPTQSDVRSMARGLAFDLTMPSGLPPGSRLTHVESYAPDAIALEYALPQGVRRSGGVLWILLTRAGRSGALHDLKNAQLLRMPKGRSSAFWRAGDELVYLDAPVSMSAGETARIESAMRAEEGR